MSESDVGPRRFEGAVERLTLARATSWASLFDACASSCFCRYWDFDGTKNEWLARLAFAPEANRDEQLDALRRTGAAEGSLRGLVAIQGEVVIGWIRVDGRARLSKLRRLPVYRGLDLGPDEGVASVACFLVAPQHRRSGVGRALLRAAIRDARMSRARAIEAYPHHRDEALREEELWMGPIGLLADEGFVAVGGNSAYPVYRLEFKDGVSDE